MCPYCRTQAPLVYRGIRAHCAACGRPRPVLSGSSLTHAGKAAHVGGAMVQVVGWIMLVIGVAVAAVVGLIVWAFATGVAALVTFAVLAAIAAGIFALTRHGGRKLESTGEVERERRREQALFALAATRGGRLQAFEAAQALDMTVEDADALLTKLAKTRSDELDVEVGDQGEIFYAFTRFARTAHPAGWAPRVRIDAAPAPRTRDVLDAEIEAVEEAALAEKRARR